MFEKISKDIADNDDTSKALRISSAISVIAGSWSLLFEISFFQNFAIDIYFARVFFTIISFTIFLLTFRKSTKGFSTFLVHILIISLIGSFVYTIYKIPDTLFINSQILSLLIFTTALVFSWEVKNQIIVAIYYNILFASSIIFNDPNFFLLPNILSITIFVCLISLLSIAVSAINYKIRNAFKSKTEEINYIFNNIPIAICRTDVQGNILTANQFLYNLLGIKKENINLLSVLKNDSFENSFSQLKTYGKNNLELTIEYTDCNNKLYYLRILGETKLNAKEEKNIDFIIKDETNETIAIREQNETTERLLNEIREKELLALRSIEEKNKKIQLLAKINHEVRTPLNSILIYHEMLEDNYLKSVDEIKKYSRAVKTAAHSLLNTINNFIDYSKIDTGNLDTEFTLFTLTEELDSVVHLLSPLAKNKGIILNLSYRNIDENNVYSDVVKYRQIVTNLVANAIKFTQKGSILITVDNTKKSENEFELITSVEDTGIGIPADKIDTIFNPFITLNDSNSSQYGNGLGLAICKEFSNMLNGDIYVQSEYGKGSKFTFNIPYSFPQYE